MTTRPPKGDLRVTPPPRLESVGVDAERLWKSIDKIASTINKSAQHTEQIPDIKRKVEATGTKVIELDTKMVVATERLTRVEDKVDDGHLCQQEGTIAEIKDLQRDSSQKIEADAQKAVRQSSEIASLKAGQLAIGSDLKDIKKGPRRMFYGLVAVILTILVYSGGAVWFLAELNKDVEFERTQRRQQFKRLEEQLEKVGTKSDNAPVKVALERLEGEIEESGGYEKQYNRMCESMTYHERRLLRGVLTKRGRRVPSSCME